MTGLPLAEVQAWMQQSLIFASDETGTAGQLIAPSSRLSGPEQLAIYQRSYYTRLLKCMVDQFPALTHALGEDLFTDFAREYLRACPSQSYTLYDLGGRFPDYLDQQRPDRSDGAQAHETWIDFMVDLASFERQMFLMFDAPGHEGQPFATADTPDEHLRLQPCFALGKYRFPVGAYYHQVQQGTEPGLPDAAPWVAALLRRDYLTHTYPLTPTHHLFLSHVSSGESIAASLDQVAVVLGLDRDGVHQNWAGVVGMRTRWIESGFFVDSRDYAPEGAVTAPRPT